MTFPLSCTTYRKRKLPQEKRRNAFNSHFYAHAYLLRSCSRFPHFLLLSRFYSLFLKEQRITVLRDKIVCRESGIIHVMLESVIIVHFFFFTIFDFSFSTWSSIYISSAYYIFSIEKQQTAYRCLLLLYLQPRIETYLADFISPVLDDRIFERYFGAVLLHPNRLFLSCCHIFVLFILLNLYTYSFIYLIQFIHMEMNRLQF